jgi:hypothetical protein
MGNSFNRQQRHEAHRFLREKREGEGINKFIKDYAKR